MQHLSNIAVISLLLNLFTDHEGVAVGCGWQALVAYINIGCYYLIGLPLGVLLGFKFDYGIKVLLILNIPQFDTHSVDFSVVESTGKG